jgi:hypothetical protein
LSRRARAPLGRSRALFEEERAPHGPPENGVPGGHEPLDLIGEGWRLLREADGDHVTNATWTEGQPTDRRSSEEGTDTLPRVEPAGDEGDEQDDGLDGGADPVRIYMRGLGAVPLLTRELEVRVAQRMEGGEHRVLEAVLGTDVGIQAIVNLGKRLQAQKLWPRECAD